MTTLRIVLGDQLTRGLSSLRDHASGDIVLMMEVAEEATYVKHHKQKLVLIFAAMRHFADALRGDGLVVDYVRLDDPANTGSFTSEVTRAIARHKPSRIVVTEPGEWRVMQMMKGWGAEILGDDRFFATPASFAAWAANRKQLRMEFFYRDMRRLSGLLMEGDEPAGGQWNFDHDNRKSLPKGVTPPKRRRFAPDAITREVMAMVGERFPDHFGDLEPFGWAVTRADALEALDHFIAACLPNFGDYQDAMKQGDAFLYHSVISPYLNIGLLTPREICEAAEQAWRRGEAPLNAVEGFIRQIIGWREYVRGIYWREGPHYVESNHLDARRPLPDFYWTGATDLNCLAQALRQTLDHGYAHHIQRLMITGNFALIAGIDPHALHQWYLAIYVDAFEWVEAPNTIGMSQFADGGLLGSKPYAAGGAYVNQMSDYCRDCRYDVKQRTGPQACPLNALYWDFLVRNRETIGGNPRLAMPYRSWDRFDAATQNKIRDSASAFLAKLEGNP